jgi:hypothetical protein
MSRGLEARPAGKTKYDEYYRRSGKTRRRRRSHNLVEQGEN